MDVRQMREIPIADFLNAMGIQLQKQNGGILWYDAPYRTERTPSFEVDTNKNVWFDFGIGKGATSLTWRESLSEAVIFSCGRHSSPRARRVRYL